MIMIHACPDRMWYVTGYLIPSMIAQGIPRNTIRIWNDTDGAGCLMSCMNAFLDCEGDGGTWHLQDDVLICRDFAEQIAGYTEGIVCGFCHTLFEPFNRPMVGDVPAVFMFNSFPCIRIPNKLARECAQWFIEEVKHRKIYQKYVEQKSHDDTVWADFIRECYPHERVYNVAPALVEHIDWLIGGSVVNQWRGYICRASYWEDEDLIIDLARQLARR